MQHRSGLVLTAALVVFGAAPHAFAATRCVQPGGGPGCSATITAALAVAAPGDTIVVKRGTYAEDVIITKPVALVGEPSGAAIIDATGLANGVNVDGVEHPGLSDVTVAGFTIRGAETEGVLVSNATRVHVTDNLVTGNDAALSQQVCSLFVPPDTPQGEGFDCGEAIHLSAVDHSTVAGNIVRGNSGGILISDDSGPTHDNLIEDNLVENNPFDCGITLASHRPVAPNGVYHNTVAGNRVLGNGLQGEGAGVGMFTPAPGTATYGNVVVGNVLVGNRLPGVALHSHAPSQNLRDNQIVRNYIAANGADTDDALTPGPTGINVFGVSPVTGTTISGNVIEHEDVAIAVRTAARVDAHRNDLRNHRVGVANLGGGTVDAIENWWGCAAGPGGRGCASVLGPSVAVVPWLDRPASDTARGRR